jgi:leader peptidase (prepilin peptidase)/N-methyltransferase
VIDSLPLILAAGFLGLLFGSFANVCIHRIPREIPLGLKSHGRSFCPHCESKVRWRDNVPVLSYILLNGRCRDCKQPISRRYPLVEILMALLFALTAGLYAYAREGSGLEPARYWAILVVQLYFVFALVVTTFVDLDFRIIPDRFSWGGWVVALVASVALGEPFWLSSLAGGLMGFGLFFVMAWGYEKWKGIEGLGFGDVKMMGWLGSWLGFESVPLIIMGASLSGLVVGLWAARRSDEGLQAAIPFGPFLALAAYGAWVARMLGYL